MIAETRTTIPDIPPDLMAILDRRDESLRLAQFAYSQTVRCGMKPSFRYVETTHENVMRKPIGVPDYQSEEDYLGGDARPPQDESAEVE